MLIVVTFGEDWAGSLVTVAHEGGHYAFAILAFRGPKSFNINDGGGGGTDLTDGSWGVGDYILTFAGYATPPLIGLGGAVLITHGNVGGVLWIAVILLLAAFLVAGNPLANAVTFLALAGVVWAAVAGSPTVQAAVAVGLVWWMMLGGPAVRGHHEHRPGQRCRLPGAAHADPAHRLEGSLGLHRDPLCPARRTLAALPMRHCTNEA